MIGIVMTYYNRALQLNRTLDSLLKSSVKDFFVVIVDDKSDESVSVKSYPFEIVRHRIENKYWSNPCPASNLGLKMALDKGADTIIIQNAECYHNGDILLHATQNLTNKNYLSYGCYSIGKEETLNSDIDVKINRKGATHDGESAWYNHSKYRPVAYEFCSAITAENIKRINGYDERLAFGWGYGDNYLLHRIKLIGLNVTIVDSPFVMHQWHYSDGKPERKILTERNKALFNELKMMNDIYAKHIITENL